MEIAVAASMKLRAPRSVRGMSILELTIAVGVLGILASFAFGWIHWEREKRSIERTIAGFHAIAEGAAAYRVDHKAWTADFNDLSPFVANLAVHSSSSAGSNGEGNPYTIQVALGEFRIWTELADQNHARVVVNRLGSAVELTEALGVYTVKMGVPIPGNVTLLESTLLMDGSNKMEAPLPVAHHVVDGGVCEEHGFGLGSDGRVFQCVDRTPGDSDPTKHWTAISTH